MILRFDEDRNFAAITLDGTLDQDTILASFDSAVAHPRYRPGMARLWDFREADLSSLSTATVQRLAQYSLGFPGGINDVKVAFVTGRDLEYGLARMFEMTCKGNTPIFVFRDLESAENWLAP